MSVKINYKIFLQLEFRLLSQKYEDLKSNILLTTTTQLLLSCIFIYTRYNYDYCYYLILSCILMYHTGMTDLSYDYWCQSKRTIGRILSLPIEHSYSMQIACSKTILRGLLSLQYVGRTLSGWDSRYSAAIWQR